MFKYFRAYRDLQKLREYMVAHHDKWYWDGDNIAVNTVMAFDAIRHELREREQEVERLKREYRGPAFKKVPDGESFPKQKGDDSGLGGLGAALNAGALGMSREELAQLHAHACEVARECGATEEEIKAVSLRDDDPVHQDEGEDLSQDPPAPVRH